MNSTTEKVYVYGSTVLVLIFVSYPHLIFHTLSVDVVHPLLQKYFVFRIEKKRFPYNAKVSFEVGPLFFRLLQVLVRPNT